MKTIYPAILNQRSVLLILFYVFIRNSYYIKQENGSEYNKSFSKSLLHPVEHHSIRIVGISFHTIRGRSPGHGGR